MKRILLVMMISFFTVPVYSQNSLSGYVFDKNDKSPLVGANVFLPELSRGVVTDSTGYYIITSLPKGEIMVTYSYIGYKTDIKEIKIEKPVQKVDVFLKPVAIQGEEVVISGNFTGSQHVNTVKISTLKSKDLLQAASPSFIEAITAIPGVDMISKGPGIATPVIRGLSTSNILFLNNGIPLQNFQFSVDHPYIIDESGVGKIEVLKGPASLLYGSGAVGGIINVLPKAPLPDGNVEGNVKFKYFSNTKGLAGNLGIRGTNNDIIWGVYGDMNSNKDYYDGDNQRVPNSRFNTNSLKADIGLIKKVGTFRLFGQYSKDNLGLTVPPSIQKVKDNDRKTSLWYQDLSNLFLQFQNKLLIGSCMTETNVAWQQNRRKLQTDYDSPYFTAVDMLLKTFNYSAKITTPVLNGFRLSGGFQGYWQNNKNFEAPDHVIPDATLNESSLFAMAQYKTEKLNVETGLRYTFFDVSVPLQRKSPTTNETIGPLDKTFNNVSFSAGITYYVTKDLLIRSNIASAFRAPNLAELTQDGVHGTRYEVGDPNLKTQRNYESDLGIHLHTIHTTLDISGFYNYINNYIYLSPSNDTTQSGLPVYYYQQDPAQLFGGEARFHIHPHPVHWLHLMADWDYTIGKKNNGEYLPFIPPQKFRFEIKLEKKKWHIFENSNIRIGTDITLAQNKISPLDSPANGYTLLDASIGTSLKVGKQKIILNISGNNLTNKTYQNYLSTLRPLNINNIGRNIALTLKIPINIYK
jgi:iron complex outermembrane receptor protein